MHYFLRLGTSRREDSTSFITSNVQQPTLKIAFKVSFLGLSPLTLSPLGLGLANRIVILAFPQDWVFRIQEQYAFQTAP